jgi:hypothetical protein
MNGGPHSGVRLCDSCGFVLEKFQLCSKEKSADATTLLGAPLICFGIKQASTRVHPLKQNQSALGTRSDKLVELVPAGQTDCFRIS